MGGQLELFEELLPNKPYASNNLTYGLRICYKQKAITKRYLQHNPPAKIHWLVFDCDKAGALEVASMNYPCPAPSFEVVNPANGHSHLFYGLTVPVVRTDMGRAKPLQYLAVVQYALGQALGADEAYSGLISKNPLHSDWQVIEHQPELWSLSELSEYLTLPKKLPPKALTVGIGRNCSLFDTVRKWAYKEVLAHRLAGSQDTFCNAVEQACETYNQFPEPLPYSEIKSISRSIGRWVWKTYTARVTDEEFSRRQTVRARKGKGVSRHRHLPETRLEAVLKARLPNANVVEVAAVYSVAPKTLYAWMKATKAAEAAAGLST